jgi:hypothetical protein
MHHSRCFAGVLFQSVAVCLLFCLANFANAERPVEFSRVRSILSDKCFKCHGFDEESREAELRLDNSESAAEVLNRNDPKKSELLRRIVSDDPDERMPPPDSKLSLTKAEIDILNRWVQSGAEYSGHWSFTAPADIAAPTSKSSWARNEIDQFVLRRLRGEGLTPNDETSKRRLIRRVTFDLTGLPPTQKEILDFVNDTDGDAYERLVDRLLERTSYGERMAATWLDVARYSDTYGYQVDRDRFVWPWRDWVIKAFNSNMPYDQFVTWQLAGDLLPNATDEQILATTFSRLHPQKVEGGSTEEEFRVEYVADRNHTFGTAFLGLTIECCRCHDHKYDPISQKEYYQLFAFFNNIDESGLYSYFTSSVPTPTLLMTNDAKKQEIAAIKEQIKVQETGLPALAKTRGEAYQAWKKAQSANNAVMGQVAHQSFEGFKSGANKSVDGRVGKAVQLTGDDAVGMGVGNFRRFDPFSVSLWMKTPDHKERAVIFHRSRAWTDAASRGYQLLLEDGKLSASLIHFWPGNAIRVVSKHPIPVGQWKHVTVTYDGSSRAAGLKLFVDGKLAEVEIVRDNLYKNISGGGGDNIAIGERFRDRGFKGGTVDEFRVFNRQLTALEVNRVASDSLDLPLATLVAADESQAIEYYLHNHDAEYKAALVALRAAREKRSRTIDGIQEIMVMRELEKPREAYLLKRGAYDARGEVVQPMTPSAFPKLNVAGRANRLDLANWLCDPQNPLTARVAVNRFWQLLFGTGIVRTPEDFGSQGAMPTHPELLDWLSRDFVNSKWDVKRLVKKIVMSATYRQSSDVSKELFQRDPENLLLARAPRYRLSAEMLRDNALSVSGLLVSKIGGPPARPYELTVSFKPVGHANGEGLYRRSVYTYWKRTAPAPVMMALDASKRDVCRVKRERTASALQSIVLMNDPQFMEAARILAERSLTEQAGDAGKAIQQIFELTTSREATRQELEILTKLYTDQLEYFGKTPTAADEIAKVGKRPWKKDADKPKLAALSIVASALFNFDQCVMKR